MMKKFLLYSFLTIALILPSIAFAGDILYDCHPYYDNVGDFNEQAFQDALILETKAADDTSNKGAFLIFLMGLGGGLIALLTPCVFPMIPLTVSFFTKGSGDRKQGIFQAIMYGFFIFLIYTLVSAPFHLLNLAPDILNQISTNVTLNVIFFIVFVVFALSFFGFYEIQLPSSLTNKISSAESTGGIIGIFFMALTLVVVSFSCTGPIVGSLLASTLSKGAWNLTAGMAGFGVALGLPFALFALFPGLMNSMPKSGGWLNTVKVFLGYLELALALKFLSNADLVDPNLVLIKRETFFAIWIIILLLLGTYFLGFYSFKKGVKEKIGKGRIAFGILFIALAGLLIPSLFAKDLTITKKVLSGFPPPMQFSYFAQDIHADHNITKEDLEHFNFHDKCPYDIPCFHDYFEAKCYAEASNKPLFLDFTGYACVNCRRMEENVWADEEILNLLANDVVLVSLYVDDRTEVPNEQKIEISYGGYTKNLKTEGNKWSFFQTVNFNKNTQPLYVMLSPDGKEILMDPVGYTPNIEEYKQLIKDGLAKHQ